MKPKKKLTATMWAVTKDGKLVKGIEFFKTKYESKNNLMFLLGWEWKALEIEGYRAIKVKVTEL
jgi:hypothetical protein